MQTPRSSLDRIVDDHPVAAFSLLAVGLSWSVWLATFSVVAPRSGVGLLGIGLGAFGPGAAGAVVTRLRGESVRSWLAVTLDWRRPLRWYALAVAVPVVGTVGVAAVVFSVAGVPEAGSLSRVVPLVVVNILLTTLFTGGNEELGWRGFALPHLQRRFGALAASLLLGGVWALWHVPMFVYGVYQLSPTLYAVSVLSFSVVLTWYYNSSDGCVLGAVLLHGTLNAVVNVPAQAMGGVAQLSIPYAAVLTGVFGLLAVLLIVLYGPETLAPGGVVRPRWRTDDATEATTDTTSSSVALGPDTAE